MPDSVRFITFAEKLKIDATRQKAEDKFREKGYVYPRYAMTLIADVYNQIFERETKQAYAANKDGVSPEVGERIDLLKVLTETKLFNALSRGEQLNFGFERRMPDEETRDFFDLTDSTESFLSQTRTDSVRLPRSFDCKKFSLEVTPEGENLAMDNKTFSTMGLKKFDDPFSITPGPSDCEQQ